METCTVNTLEHPHLIIIGIILFIIALVWVIKSVEKEKEDKEKEEKQREIRINNWAREIRINNWANENLILPLTPKTETQVLESGEGVEGVGAVLKVVFAIATIAGAIYLFSL